METSIFDQTMANMTWVEIEQALSTDNVVLLPSGILEEHGPHLSIAPDIYFSCEIAKSVKRRLTTEHNRNTVIAPPTYWGITQKTAGYPGSFILRKETLQALFVDILTCLHRWGARHIFIIDVHDDSTHREAILSGIQEARKTHGVNAMSIVSRKLAQESKLVGNENYVLIKNNNPTVTQFTDIPDIHAGALEGSFMKQYFPHAFRSEVVPDLKPTSLKEHEWVKWNRGWSEAREVNPLGYNGDPAKINTLLAEQYIETEGKNISLVIQQFLENTYVPPEI